MKKQKKLLALAISLTCSVSILAGCSKGVVSIYSAIQKDKTITSAEVQTDLSVKLSAKNLSADEKKNMNDLLNLNGSELHLLTKFNQNSNKTIFKSQTDINGRVGTNSIQTSIWTNSDSSTKTPSTTAIVKVPKFISDKILQLKGKDYIVATNAGDVKTNQINYKKLADLEPKLSAFISEYMKNFNPAIDPVKSLGSKKIVQNGKQVNVNVYQLTLNDSSLKSLIHYAVNNLNNNKTSLPLLKNYLESLVSIIAPSQSDAANAIKGIEDTFATFNNNLPNITKQIDSQISLFDKVKVIGDKGITIQFAIDNKGYLVNQQGDIEIVIDTARISKAVGDKTSTATGIYTINFHFSNDIRNINGKVDIAYPKTTSANSVNMKFNNVPDLVDIYNAHTTVDYAVKSNNVDQINDAMKNVQALTDVVDKTSMLSQLNGAFNKIALQKAKELVSIAKKTKLVADYDNAYNRINQLQASIGKPLMTDLNTVYSQIFTSDVNVALNVIKNLMNDKNKDIRKFDAAKQAINKGVKLPANRDYLISMLANKVGKEIFTVDVNKALDAINVASKKYTDANVKAAKDAISKVKNVESAKYLQEMLSKAKPVIKK